MKSASSLFHDRIFPEPLDKNTPCSPQHKGQGQGRKLADSCIPLQDLHYKLHLELLLLTRAVSEPTLRKRGYQFFLMEFSP